MWFELLVLVTVAVVSLVAIFSFTLMRRYIAIVQCIVCSDMKHSMHCTVYSVQCEMAPPLSLVPPPMRRAAKDAGVIGSGAATPASGMGSPASFEVSGANDWRHVTRNIWFIVHMGRTRQDGKGLNHLCDTLRSWLHEVSAVILTLSPGLEKN